MISTQTSNLTVRLDAQLKKDAEKLFNELGMTLSGAINIFLHQSIEHQGLPFQVKKKRPNRETLAAMKEALELEKTGGGKTYKSVKEFMEDLENDIASETDDEDATD